jgi:aminopeptidase C
VDTAQKKEPEDGRLVQYLLTNPTNDGGQWDMLVNIVGKSPSLMALKPSMTEQSSIVRNRLHTEYSWSQEGYMVSFKSLYFTFSSMKCLS